ncbi:MAG: dihydropteroate synthase [Lachnospiraceae bacterium]|nr:dihydropteroate synthase [Lachnospiraceae bacterium]
MKIGSRDFLRSGRTYIMGILNLTPDSFYDGGWHADKDAALKCVREMIDEGADVIDVGGESTRPGHTPVSLDEELRRVIPVIEAVRARYDIPVSVDTYKAEVARLALDAGADLVNDISGLTADETMAKLIADRKVPCCIMHNDLKYDVAADDRPIRQRMEYDIMHSLTLAKAAGIDDSRIILDPGIGFAKSFEDNLKVLKDPDYMLPRDYPLLVAVSRKSVIGNALDLPKEERLEGTMALSVMAAMRGAMFVRVHDVKENYRAVRMTEAVYGCDQD